MGQTLGACMCHEADVEMVASDKDSRLHDMPGDFVVELVCAAALGDVIALQKALDKGANVNAVDYDRRSALHIAVQRGHCEIVRAMVEARADANLQDRWGCTPLDRAVENDAPQLQELLLVAGAIPGQQSPLADSEGMAPFTSTQTTYSSQDPNLVAAGALCCAAAANSLELLQQLHTSGSDLNSPDSRGRTALHLACAYGHLEIVRWLVSMGAGVDCIDQLGRTPMKEAVKHGHSEVVALLQENGARSHGRSSVVQQAEEHQWAIPVDDVELGRLISKTIKSAIYRGTYRGTQVVCKTTTNLRASRYGAAQDAVAYGETSDAEAELLHEIRLLAQLRHPDLVMFLGAVVAYHPPLLISEFMEGGDLEHYYSAQAKRKGQFFKPPPGQVYKWAGAVARALAFLHENARPIIHRDLKPMNLLLGAHKELKVTDFGISKLLNPKPPGSDELARSHGKPLMSGGVGTWRYMAPEVVRYEQYTDRVDIYSLGLIMWFMCTGRQPFVQEFGQDAELVLKAYLRGEEPRPNATAMKSTNHFRELVTECWNASPERRPPAQQCAQRLAAMCA